MHSHGNDNHVAADQADVDDLGRLWIDLGSIDDRLIRIERRLAALLILNSVALAGIATLLVLA